MIYVTLGTQDKSFHRLLEEIQKQIEKGKIKEKVIVQAGCTDFKSDDMEIFDLVGMDDFNKYMNECDLLITHGGVGSIIDGLKNEKKVIAVPRLSKYKEHTNDHQLQIVKNFDIAGYIIGLEDVSELEKALDKLKTFKPKKYKSNTKNMIKLIQKHIDS